VARQNVSELLHALTPALQVAAKNVLRHAFGPDGMPWGTRFTELEDIAVHVGDLLAREVLRTALHTQAHRPPPAPLQTCPTCARPLDPRPPEERAVRTDPGVVTWPEPATFCPRCRRAFFPSVQEPGA
jgi:hypothetical protein